MKTHITKLLTMGVLAGLGLLARAGEVRQTLSLDGTWQIAEGTLNDVPKNFDHQVPVPGLADMAVPAFEAVGVKDKDPRREAFWYRRSFTVAGPVPAVARLKVHKACYGTAVYLNGTCLGEHVGCFTPGYFDLGGKLKGGGQPNELIIRVGASHVAVGEDVPWGHDFEKLRYVPGIYDSVELILSASPDIENLQCVPDVPGKQVRVVAEVKNPGAAATEAVVRCKVRDAKTHAAAGTAESRKVLWKPGERQTVDLTIPLQDCRLWTPDDPYLYEVEVAVVAGATTTDVQTTRFGMRSFAFDPQTKLPLLNGKTCYLRGTNICIYRFFEDPLRGDKPWREEWVRRVIRGFRSMNWNCARYCIGFPPEMWYRIADEEGLMIQDEFPVWGQTGTLEKLTGQYAEWMRERWNHPSVVIWDAQNETPGQQITGQALTAVRKLDLSNRPWDNGWDKPQAATDVYEAHPYRHITKTFRMEEFAKMSPKPGDPGSEPGNEVPNTGDNPIIINEYGWLWINRDGTPCTLPVAHNSYQYLLPSNPTADQYREAYARTVAAKTEFWRSGRKVAGVMHFCGLGYSRPGGQTSDNFIDLERSTLEPRFVQHVRDAFAPVGLMIDAWAADYPAGKPQAFPVAVINDLQEHWQGTVRFRLLREGNVIQQKTLPCEVPALGKVKLEFVIELSAQAGRFQVEAALIKPGIDPVRSLRDFQIKAKEAGK